MDDFDGEAGRMQRRVGGIGGAGHYLGAELGEFRCWLGVFLPEKIIGDRFECPLAREDNRR